MIINKGFKPKRVSNDRLPPGQYETRDFPVLSLGPTPIIKLADWKFEIFGEAKPLSWNWEEFNRLPMIDIHNDIHCVTKWSKFDTNWRGVDVTYLMQLADVPESTTHIVFHSYDGYTTNVPLEEIRNHPASAQGSGEARQAIIATAYEGEAIEAEHGGPARGVIPHLYFWKSAKWVKAMEFLDHDEPGFWEVRGYNNHGDPWKEERYSDF